MSAQLPTYIAEVRGLMESKMWIKGCDLRHQVRKAGRRLPRKIRRDMRHLIDASRLDANPKLARMVNDDQIKKAHANVVAYLERLDPREAMWTRILNIAASVALALIVVFVLVLYVLVQRGFV
ncbi:hypothetical protein [Yoonia sp. SS1-5]|uniref:Uncharacterized protein n=1 Tax=Yoonia rhodophyticola TaxID=3137370 RepID=A0AAN0MIA9_9RHOB